MLLWKNLKIKIKWLETNLLDYRSATISPIPLTLTSLTLSLFKRVPHKIHNAWFLPSIELIKIPINRQILMFQKRAKKGKRGTRKKWSALSHRSTSREGEIIRLKETEIKFKIKNWLVILWKCAIIRVKTSRWQKTANVTKVLGLICLVQRNYYKR